MYLFIITLFGVRVVSFSFFFLPTFDGLDLRPPYVEGGAAADKVVGLDERVAALKAAAAAGAWPKVREIGYHHPPSLVALYPPHTTYIKTFWGGGGGGGGGGGDVVVVGK